MSKPIPEDVKARFIQFVDEMNEQGIPDFCWDAIIETGVVKDEDQEGWEFGAANHDPEHDIYELFQCHPDHQIEEHGRDYFIIAPRAQAE